KAATKPFVQPSNGDDPDMDELDALLAAENSAKGAPETTTASKANAGPPPEDDEFDFDDIDMLREMENSAVKEKEAAQKRGPRRVVEDDDEDEEFDLEEMAALREAENAQGNASKAPTSSTVDPADAQNQKR